MVTATIFGHSKAKSLLEQQVRTGGLSHAYLFFGPNQVGKYSVAKDFAQSILQAPEGLRGHPDFFELDILEHSTIEELRNFLATISTRPVKAQRKVAVLNNFEHASDLMGNVLLKTLEEPSPSTVIIIITSRPVLPTIVSRCQVIAFNRLSDEEMNQFMASASVEAPQALVELASGAPGRLLSLLQNDSATSAVVEWTDKLAAAFAATVAERLLLVSELGSQETEVLRNVLTAYIQRQRLLLAQMPTTVIYLRKALDALEQLQFNLNKKLVLQRLLL